MNVFSRLLLGAVTLWPISYILAWVLVYAGLTIFLQDGPPLPDGFWDPIFGFGLRILVVNILTALCLIGTTVFYIVQAIRNEKLDSNGKERWVLLFFFFSIIAQPIYWYTSIWRDVSFRIDPAQLNPLDASNWVRPEQQTREREYVPPSEPPDWR